MTRKITHIVIHCTATSQRATIPAIQKYWRDVLKWRSPGYHKIIDLSGTVHTLAPDHKICNGVSGYNSSSLHVSYIGGIDKTGKPQDTRSPEQTRSLLEVITHWKTLYPSAIILGHRDFPNVAKECPSFCVSAWLSSLSPSKRPNALQKPKHA